MSFSTRRLTENLSVVKNKMSIFTRRFTLENFANKPNAKRRKTCEKPYDQLVKEHPKYPLLPVITKQHHKVSNCWTCYKSNADIDCTTCEKSFHTKCKSLDVNGICTDCRHSKFLKKTSEPSVVQKLNEQLQLVVSATKLDTCIESDLMPIVQNMLLSAKDITNLTKVLKFNCDLIKENLKEKKYESGDQFAIDIKTIIYKFFAALDFRHETNTKLHNWAKKFLKSYKDQLVYLDLCGDCYENSVNIDDWFITVCSNKHRVVWAHYRNHPPWPAKVLREEKNFITVQFFGEHTLGKLKRDKVFDYSQKNPNELSDTVKSKKMKECLPEVELYLNNLNRVENSNNLAVPAVPADDHPLNLLFNKFHHQFSTELQIYVNQSEDLRKENKILERELNVTCKEFSKLEEENINLSTDRNDLSAKARHLEVKYANISKKVQKNDMETKLTEEKNHTDALKLKIADLESQLERVEEENSNKDLRIEQLLKDLESCKSQQKMWKDNLEAYMEMGKVLGDTILSKK